MQARPTEAESRPAPATSPDSPPPSSSALQLTGLTRRFGHVTALDGIDLTVNAGQFMVLLGPSGSGKTTLLKLVAGIDRASAGSIAIGTRIVADQRLHVAPERRGLAMVFQQYALWPQVSVLANVVYALDRLHLPRQESRRRALAMLDRVGLVRLANRRPPELSGGEQQRVALARALVARPAVLLCDEPLSNLDADLRERLRAEIATLARENDTTVVYITHDQVEAFALADRIGVLQDGRLVQCDLPESVYHAPATPFVARFTGVAGELHGRVAGRPDSAGRFLVDTPNGPLAASGPAPEPLGSAVTVLVRPAAARLVPSVDDDSGLLSRVRDVAYRGHGYDHLVELADGTLLTGVFAEQRYQRSEEVRVRLDPSGSFAYRADASA
ncbi:ABC transporter ATP-binding protein [Actinacidiphila oryziradicis]|uniref:ABC-type quaternary amine transporter n=1 Tax=Actinacidiphila oryziradicis TaxID=2571141 RepID=A0A4U0RJA1_9ACTN|nr:ABC transporter ATP-binding protein [Actinacidiphila oryziradicis]